MVPDRLIAEDADAVCAQTGPGPGAATQSESSCSAGGEGLDKDEDRDEAGLERGARICTDEDKRWSARRPRHARRLDTETECGMINTKSKGRG